MSGKRWTQAELRILHEFYPLYGSRVVAKKLKCTFRRVEMKAARENVRRIKRKVEKEPREVRIPPGSERIDRYGFIMIKLSNGVWRHKHRVKYEEYHGAIPEGGSIGFRNGIRSDCSIENLYLTSAKEQLKRNTVHNLPEELRSLIHLKSNLTKLIMRRSKDEQHADPKEQPLRLDDGASGGQD